MPVEIIKIVILAFLIVLSILTLYFLKKDNINTPVFEGFDANGPMPRDFDNKELSDEQLYGDIPQNATISIFKKAELKGLMANPDAIPIANGDARGNYGAYLTLTDIPPQTPPHHDIESVLNAALDVPHVPNIMEGFASKHMIKPSKHENMNMRNISPDKNHSKLTTFIRNQYKEEESTDKQKIRLEETVRKHMKNSSHSKMSGKAVTKAKTVALKGMKKVTHKIEGHLANKISARMGPKTTDIIFKKLANKIVEKVTSEVTKAQIKVSSKNPFNTSIGVMLKSISALAIAVGIALPIMLKGNKGICEDGWQKVSDEWPRYLEKIPGSHDMLGVIAPYLCYHDGCIKNEEEDGGICYDKCRNGYHGNGNACLNKRGKGSYERGPGNPKLKLKMVRKAPPPSAPPSLWMSAAYADNTETNCKIDFSLAAVLQDMCDFYYTAAFTTAKPSEDGTVSFGYISKIIRIIGSSEQSADVLCDITNVVVNMDTGKTNSSTVVTGCDRRFYFAKIDKICKFIVVGATNVNKTGRDVTGAQSGDAKEVSFSPAIKKCIDIPISMNKCKSKDSIEAMMEMYKKTLPPTIRIKSVDAVQNHGNNTCVVAWKEVSYDPTTNVETSPISKVGNFKYVQDKTTDACVYKLEKYDPAEPSTTVKPLENPLVYSVPVPTDFTLQGCTTKCTDPIMVQKLIAAFNNQPGNNRILSVGKVVTSGPLRCDIEADVLIKQTGNTEKQRVRFDLKKEQASCVFSVATTGGAGTGSFIQDNTAALDTSIDTKDTVMAGTIDTVKSAQTNISAASQKITSAYGMANTIYEKIFSQFGQVETLGACPKKCSDPDVLDAIITYYNTVNFPTSRKSVTKKTMGRVLKTGTAGTNVCDIQFEEKQETYGDLYTDTPTVNVTQKTQRFTMKDIGGCTFAVDSIEGFKGVPFKPKEGFQAKMPSVVNSATPELSPPYTDGGCVLDCTNADIMTSMKEKYQSTNIEGFQNKRNHKKGFLSSFFASFSEAFQDASDDVTVDPTTDLPTDTGTPDWNAATDTSLTGDEPVTSNDISPEDSTTSASSEPSASVKPGQSTNMKSVNRVLKLGVDKCEFEVVYDATDTDATGTTTNVNDKTGYFTAIFTKDPTGCAFIASQVTKTDSAIIPTISEARTSNVSFSF